MEDRILGFDIANKPDITVLCFHFRNTCLEEMKELWSIGDEYPMPEFNKNRLGLSNESKFIIHSMYEDDNKDVFMNMLIR